MTEHEHIEYLLFGFLNGKLGKDDEKVITDWIDKNEENRKEFERYKRIFKEQRRHVSDQKVILSREKLKNALLYKFFRTKQKDRLIIRGLIISFLASSGLFIGYTSNHYSETDQIYADGLTIVKTEPGETSSCVLPDNTKIWLNYDSEIQYRLLSDRSGTIREVKVRGEAYFDVAKEKKVPFEVLSGNTKVKVYGTQFNVHQQGNGLQLTLVEGSMAVFTREDVKISQLVPGDQVLLNQQGELISKQTIDVTQTISWKEGRYEFKDVTLEEIASHLNEMYRVHIVFQSKSLKDARFRCVIDRKQSLLQTLQILKETGNLNYSINGSDILLTKN